MELTKTNIHNFIVQSAGTLTILAVSIMNAFPEPALAFAQEVSVQSVYFPRADIFEVTATAYSSTVEQTDSSPFITASGSHVHHGTIAANFLPLGSVVRINNELFEVEDRMGQRYNDAYHIDIWMASIEEARQFGAKTILIEVVGK